MLPINSVHLLAPGLAKYCKALGIDYANAQIGWDFHSRKSHPLLHGIVVAKQFAPLLMDVYESEMTRIADEQARKEKQHYIGLWKRFTRALLIYHYLIKSPHQDGVTKLSTRDLQDEAESESEEEKGGQHVHKFPKSTYVYNSEKDFWSKTCKCGLTVEFEEI